MLKTIPYFSALLLLALTHALSAQSGGVPPPSALPGESDQQVRPEQGPAEDDFTEPVPHEPTAAAATAPGTAVGSLSQSPWFALTSGMASIVGLLLALYTTQVRPIPFSLYRSLVWRKALMIAGGAGLAVFAGIELAQLDGALRRVFELIFFLPSERHPNDWFTYRSGYVLTILWVASIIFGVALSRRGVRFDPIAAARNIIIREQAVIGKARAEQIDNLLRGRRAEHLALPERRALRDVMDFYRYVQWRYADVVLGAPPPAFPLFRGDTTTDTGEDDA